MVNVGLQHLLFSGNLQDWRAALAARREPRRTGWYCLRRGRVGAFEQALGRVLLHVFGERHLLGGLAFVGQAQARLLVHQHRLVAQLQPHGAGTRVFQADRAGAAFDRVHAEALVLPCVTLKKPGFFSSGVTVTLAPSSHWMPAGVARARRPPGRFGEHDVGLVADRRASSTLLDDALGTTLLRAASWPVRPLPRAAWRRRSAP